MNHYMEIGFVIRSKKLFGLGERITDFVLKPGTYALFSKASEFETDMGDSDQGKQQMGQHPFIMA